MANKGTVQSRNIPFSSFISSNPSRLKLSSTINKYSGTAVSSIEALFSVLSGFHEANLVSPAIRPVIAELQSTLDLDMPLRDLLLSSYQNSYGTPASDINHALRRAAALGDDYDVELILSYFNDEVDINSQPAMGTQRTALHWAANNGHLRTVKILINHMASTTIQDAQGNTVLELAIANGNTDIIHCISPEEQCKYSKDFY